MKACQIRRRKERSVSDNVQFKMGIFLEAIIMLGSVPTHPSSKPVDVHHLGHSLLPCLSYLERSSPGGRSVLRRAINAVDNGGTHYDTISQSRYFGHLRMNHQQRRGDHMSLNAWWGVDVLYRLCHNPQPCIQKYKQIAETEKSSSSGSTCAREEIPKPTARSLLVTARTRSKKPFRSVGRAPNIQDKVDKMKNGS